MKPYIKFLLVVLSSAFVCMAYAGAVTSYLDPLKGYYTLKSIPGTELYRTFCQLEYEKEDNIPPERVNNCREALSLIGTRLMGMAAGFVDNPIDLQFIKQLNNALLQDDELYHAAAEPPARYGIKPQSEDAIKENISIAVEIYSVTGTDLQTAIHCSSAQNDESLIKIFDRSPYFREDSALEGYYQQAKACLEVYDYEEKQYPGDTDYQAFYSWTISKWMRQKPEPLKSRTTDRVNKTQGHYIFSLPTEAQVPFLTSLFEKINDRLKNHTWSSEESRDTEIVKASRALFLTHAFHDGNTRTSRLVLNMLRLSAGLEPFHSYLLPNAREWSATEMVRQYYLSLIQPSPSLNAAQVVYEENTDIPILLEPAPRPVSLEPVSITFSSEGLPVIPADDFLPLRLLQMLKDLF